MKSLIRIAGTLVLLAGGLAASGSGWAQTPARTFPETGKTVQGAFLAYWEQHGGLAQQGYPISDQMVEISPLNSQPYTVQYFERAVFEAHPENRPPYDVLLSQLGTFRYQQKYPAGAPGQQASSEDARLFPETGKHLGGKFRTYWETHGDLAQQGYPISEEFQEISPLNGQTYTVQYFERAVFEAHPENAPPFDVLLSQLGTFQYQAKYQATPTPPPPTLPPTPVPATATPTPDPRICTGLPANHDMTVDPDCGYSDRTPFRFQSIAFSPSEEVHVHFITPDGTVVSTEFTKQADSDGRFDLKNVYFRNAPPGIWTVRLEGTTHQPYGYFKILRPDTPGIKP